MIITITKILLSLLLGLLIGFERERSDKPAGVRSCTLVTLSMTYAMLLNLRFQEYGFAYDFARIPAYAIASIGFLGSGVIILNKKKLEGVTTASVMLVLVVIGLLSGLGEFYLAASLGVLTYLTLISKYIKCKLSLNWRKKGKKCFIKK